MLLKNKYLGLVHIALVLRQNVYPLGSNPNTVQIIRIPLQPLEFRDTGKIRTGVCEDRLISNLGLRYTLSHNKFHGRCRYGSHPNVRSMF